MRDQFETMEDRLEASILYRGDGEYVQCVGCRKLVPIGEAEPASPHPYSPFICGSCFDTMIEDQEIDSQIESQVEE